MPTSQMYFKRYSSLLPMITVSLQIGQVPFSSLEKYKQCLSFFNVSCDFFFQQKRHDESRGPLSMHKQEIAIKTTASLECSEMSHKDHARV